VPERPTRITVVGRAQCSADVAELARQVGEKIAQRGAVLVCGGLGGVMEAACRGAAEAGGLTIGILPGIDPDSANEHVIIPVPTGMGEARNVINVRAGEVVIALDGGYGTLSEIAVALRAGIPVVALGAWQEIDEVTPAASPEEAVRAALELAGAASNG